MIIIQHGLAMSKQPWYASVVKGTVPFLSPELFFKWDKSKGLDYPVDVFKNDVYANGILSIEQFIILPYTKYKFIYNAIYFIN